MQRGIQALSRRGKACIVGPAACQLTALTCRFSAKPPARRGGRRTGAGEGRGARPDALARRFTTVEMKQKPTLAGGAKPSYIEEQCKNSKWYCLHDARTHARTHIPDLPLLWLQGAPGCRRASRKVNCERVEARRKTNSPPYVRISAMKSQERRPDVPVDGSPNRPRCALPRPLSSLSPPLSHSLSQSLN